MHMRVTISENGAILLIIDDDQSGMQNRAALNECKKDYVQSIVHRTPIYCLSTK